MWIDDAGTAHTVSAPDWRTVIRIDKESRSMSNHLLQQVEDERNRIYAALLSHGMQPDGPKDQLPSEPIDVPAGVLADPSTLPAFIDSIPEWWRLDVLDALEMAAEDG